MQNLLPCGFVIYGTSAFSIPNIQRPSAELSEDDLLHTPCLLVSCLVPEWPPIAYKLYLSGLQSHANCTAWPPVACKFRPILFMLHATSCHAGTIYMRLAASRMQTLHALAASCVQSHHFFASTLREQLYELKNEDAIKKSVYLRDTCAC